MNTLRNLLKAQHPGLSEALERSWKIALEQWLPAVSPSSSSFNSYPHLRNVEACLDGIINAFTPHSADASACFLNPLEIYVLLASILFHDIGHPQEEAAKKRDPNAAKHAFFSRRTIVNDFAQLGIPSRELAGVIGDIALQHDPPDGTPDNLSETAISPYGRLRCQPLAALLILADRMDGAYSRALPVYLNSAEEVEIKGAFRREVLAVQTDPKSRLILTVLSHDFPTMPDNLSSWIKPAYNLEGTPSTPSSRKKSPALISRIYRKLLDAIEERHKQNNSFDKNDINIIHKAGFIKIDTTGDLNESNRLVSEEKCKIERTKNASGVWPPGALLAVVLSDLKKNCHALSAKKADLAAIGVNLADWMVEYQGHLYDAEGQETIEPVLSWEYLEEVTEAMWQLTAGVFAQGLFSYEELAAEVGDYDLQRIKLATRRLAILTEELGKVSSDDSTKTYGAFQVLDDRWRWTFKKRTFKKRNNGFRYVTKKKVMKVIKALSKPAQQIRP
jgi:hypothetical protein